MAQKSILLDKSLLFAARIIKNNNYHDYRKTVPYVRTVFLLAISLNFCYYLNVNILT